MVTKNYKNLLKTMLQSSSVAHSSFRMRAVNGDYRYSTTWFYFPASRVETITTNANAEGISIGRGATPPTENDYNLEDTITSGFSFIMNSVTPGIDSDGNSFIDYRFTITNNSSSEVLSISEIGHKQKAKTTRLPNVHTTNNNIAQDTILLLDRTVLDTPFIIQPEDAGIINYRLTTISQPEKTVHGVKIVSFTYGSDEDVAAMIDAARQGTIDLQEDGEWSVGDVRYIDTDSFTAGNGDVIAAQAVPIIITSFEDYNECGCLFQFDFYNVFVGGMRMNPTTATTGGYRASEFYTTTLPAIVEALPNWLKSRLKTFDVLANTGSGADLHTIETISGNKLALRAAVEIDENSSVAIQEEGTQLDYYRTAILRLKYSETVGTRWFLRTVADGTHFSYVDQYAGVSSMFSSSREGIAPFGCI